MKLLLLPVSVKIQRSGSEIWHLGKKFCSIWTSAVCMTWRSIFLQETLISMALPVICQSFHLKIHSELLPVSGAIKSENNITADTPAHDIFTLFKVTMQPRSIRD